jgi:hypothetical protein
VLPCARPPPAWDVEGDRLDAGSLRDDVDDIRELPGQSPQ